MSGVGSDLVLGIETSCDETAASVVKDGTRVLSSIVASQIELHSRFGGVVPEIAGRAHVELLAPVVSEALETAGVSGASLAGVAATVGPGLIGSLLVGVSSAKALAFSWGVPFVGVNHLEGHLYAATLEQEDLSFPLVTLLVSGGHTMLVLVEGRGRYSLLGETLDDAAGEAFDKVARALGLGYPGGPAIERAARTGDPKAVDLPRPLLHRGFELSFSGLKTAVVRRLTSEERSVEDFAASFQEAVVDVLIHKASKALLETGAPVLCLAGGVAANSRLRERALELEGSLGVRVLLPSKANCTDNAAMIAAAGWWRLASDGPAPMDLSPRPNLALAVSR